MFFAPWTLGVALSDLYPRRRALETTGVAATEGAAHPTKALARFLSHLQVRSQPVLLDLGPVVGSNLTFFGEQRGCKIFVENLYKDIDRHVRDGTVAALPESLARRLVHRDASVDGILCWDVFDYLERAAANAVARQLTRLLRPDGVLLALFAASEPTGADDAVYTRFVVRDPVSLEHRTYPAPRGRGRPIQNREIQRLFAPLCITEQFLLKRNVREVLLRKPPTHVPDTL